MSEPWLRGTLPDIPAVQSGVIHALELAREDVARWCGDLTNQQLNARPEGLAPVAFHLRHIARSLDRMLTYAENRDLNAQQLAGLKTELAADATREQVLAEFDAAIETSTARVRRLDPAQIEEARAVGRSRLPTTLGGLLVHIADHTQRHVGQAVVTAKVVRAERDCSNEARED